MRIILIFLKGCVQNSPIPGVFFATIHRMPPNKQIVYGEPGSQKA
jgi:hypothetical protein